MRIVAFGGGTGLSNILTGFKKDYQKKIKNLTAIVTVCDSGGSSGILKKIYDIPAVGDIRNCLLSLSNIENYMKKVMQYRFKVGEGFSGHPLGNLFLVALLETEGDILKAVKKASKILNISGEVIPVSFDKVELIAEFEDGQIIQGEENITNYGLFSKQKISNLKIKPINAKIPIEIFNKIKKADILIFGPGSLYTSILPNLLFKEVKNAVNFSKALKIFIVNLLTQPGETDNFTASDHIKEFLRISGLEKIDVAILNNGQPTRKQKEIMKKENKTLVEPDVENIFKMGIKVYSKDLINKKDIYIKHEPYVLKKLIFKVAKDYGLI